MKVRLLNKFKNLVEEIEVPYLCGILNHNNKWYRLESGDYHESCAYFTENLIKETHD